MQSGIRHHVFIHKVIIHEVVCCSARACTFSDVGVHHPVRTAVVVLLSCPVVEPCPIHALSLGTICKRIHLPRFSVTAVELANHGCCCRWSGSNSCQLITPTLSCAFTRPAKLTGSLWGGGGLRGCASDAKCHLEIINQCKPVDRSFQMFYICPTTATQTRLV